MSSLTHFPYFLSFPLNPAGLGLHVGVGPDAALPVVGEESGKAEHARVDGAVGARVQEAVIEEAACQGTAEGCDHGDL